MLASLLAPSLPRRQGCHAPMTPLPCSRLQGPGGLLPPRPAPLQRRSCALRPIARASKGGGGAPSPDQPPSYADALQQREFELWQRQARLYDTLLEQHEAERLHWATERERWAATEASLKQEVAELRAQLLYVLSSRAGGGLADARSSSASSAGAGAYAPPPPATLPGRPPAQLPLGAAGLSPAEQVKAVVDAARAGSAFAEPAAESSASSSGGSSLAGAQIGGGGGGGGGGAGTAGGVPRYAAELAAAVAAVDELDVLAADLDFGALADRLVTRQGVAPAPAPEPAAPATPTASAPAAAPAAGAAEEEEGAAAPAPAGPPPGPRPTLVSGSDDIYWMDQLHRALLGAGYYPGDDDIEDFFFGESTLSAVLTMQACSGLAETGVVDEAAWAVLLAAVEDEEEGQQPPSAPAVAPAVAAASPAAEPKPYQELFAQALGGAAAPAAPAERAASPSVRAVHEVVITDSVQSVGGEVRETVTVHEESVLSVQSVQRSGASAAPRTEWPVLMEGDGGKDVHALHVALQQNGYYASEDDMRWWQFGDSTVAALKTFQACSGLPESGVADPGTWRGLLGAGASPADLAGLRSEDSADEDLSVTDRVWLMGEQRWEDRSRVGRKGSS